MLMVSDERREEGKIGNSRHTGVYRVTLANRRMNPIAV